MSTDKPPSLDSRWYYATKHRQFGPVTFQELRRIASRGELQPTDKVLEEGTDTWQWSACIAGLWSLDTPACESLQEPIGVTGTTDERQPVVRPNDAQQPFDPYRCPDCGIINSRTKRYYLHSFTFLGFWLYWQEDKCVACPSCMRWKLLKRIPIDLLRSNVLFPFVFLSGYPFYLAQTFLPGPSRSDVKTQL